MTLDLALDISQLPTIELYKLKQTNQTYHFRLQSNYINALVTPAPRSLSPCQKDDHRTTRLFGPPLASLRSQPP